MSSPSIFSFADVVGSITNPLVPPFFFSGQLGVGHFTIGYSTERTVKNVAADGAVMMSAILGDDGTFSVEAQQTSTIDSYLLNLFNLLVTLQQNRDVSNWATTNIQIQSVTNATQHVLSGVAFTKPPDYPYGKEGALITWNFMVANVVSTSL